MSYSRYCSCELQLLEHFTEFHTIVSRVLTIIIEILNCLPPIRSRSCPLHCSCAEPLTQNAPPKSPLKRYDPRSHTHTIKHTTSRFTRSAPARGYRPTRKCVCLIYTARIQIDFVVHRSLCVISRNDFSPRVEIELFLCRLRNVCKFGRGAVERRTRGKLNTHYTATRRSVCIYVTVYSHTAIAICPLGHKPTPTARPKHLRELDTFHLNACIASLYQAYHNRSRVPNGLTHLHCALAAPV